MLSSDLAQPWIERSGEVEAELVALPGVTDVSPFYTMAGICETRTELAGVILKGTGPETHNELLAASMTRGGIPLGLTADSCVLSEALAAQLQVDTGDRVGIYLVSDRGDVRPRVLTLAGLYNTGMLEFDEQFVFIPQGHIQKTAGWGVELLVTMSGDTATARMIGEGRPSFEWRFDEGRRWGGTGPHVFDSVDSVQVVLRGGERMGADSATLRRRADGTWAVEHAGGAWRTRASGLEVRIADFAELHNLDDAVFAAVPFGWRTETVLASSPDLFAWLGMLDLNVEIIIGLMVLIAVINMSSAMLIIILERRPMIGVLRALGMPRGAVLQIFVAHGVRILGRGFAVGNVLGISLVMLQAQTALVKLDPAAYYLDRVPVELHWGTLGLLELAAFGVSAGMLWLPGLASAQIQPAQILRTR